MWLALYLAPSLVLAQGASLKWEGAVVRKEAGLQPSMHHGLLRVNGLGGTRHHGIECAVNLGACHTGGSQILRESCLHALIIPRQSIESAVHCLGFLPVYGSLISHEHLHVRDQSLDSLWARHCKAALEDK